MKALVALALVAAMLCGSAMAASLGAKVYSSSMPVYRSKSGSRVATLRRGTSFKVTSVSGSWAKISYRGRTGYAKLSNIVFNKHIKAVTTKSSSIRFMTKDSYRKGVYYTGKLAAGVTVYIAGVQGDKLLFFNENGDTMGLVSKSAVGKAKSSQYVYITLEDGKKYHTKSCPSIQGKNSKKVPLDWAVANGYTKCKIKNG